jgi:hypothetical protein
MQQFTRQLNGGLYCLGLENMASVPPNSGMATVTNLAQFVALQMKLTP